MMYKMPETLLINGLLYRLAVGTNELTVDIEETLNEMMAVYEKHYESTRYADGAREETERVRDWLKGLKGA